MDAKDYVTDYAIKADKFLESYFDQKTLEVKEMGGSGEGIAMASEMLKRYRNFSHGGKKLRGALIKLGYEIVGGKSKEILKASASIEIIHSFLLMHDDIMDMDSYRRGALTIHKQFEKDQGSYHYGVSMGIDMGDLGGYMGMELILD